MNWVFKTVSTIAILVLITSCANTKNSQENRSQPSDISPKLNVSSEILFDSLKIDKFYTVYPDLNKYKTYVKTIYRKYGFHRIWFDQNGIIESGHSLYERVAGISQEGIFTEFPYNNQVAGIFESDIENELTDDETDIMITNMFLFYVNKAIRGINDQIVESLEWLLPKKQVSYEALLDSLILHPELVDKDTTVVFGQYYKLSEMLKKYHAIESNGGWKTIVWDPKEKSYKPGDTANVILQIRERLFITGDIEKNNGSNRFDADLEDAVKKFQLRTANTPQKIITKSLVDNLNVPVSEILKKIVVNMERSRWISPELAKADEFIFVNIPSYMLFYNRNQKRIFESPVVVGKKMNKTVIFSGQMSSIVFSPYWNVPASIMNNEIKPGIKKDPNYLAKHNMEYYNNGQIRQKPGKNNSLGKVKFLFPNSNNIYLHDTPAKSLFSKDDRAFSHGCSRVGKPRELAVVILENDPEWTPAKIDSAMNANEEKWYTLKKKLPVYIGYFTAWVDDKNVLNLYDDVYSRDQRLFNILTGNN